MILFKRKRMAPDLKDGAPEGSLVINNESGWMDKDMFVIWLRHFVAAVKPSPTQKVLLILDGHGSHTKSLDAINFAREHGIVMISLPPHTTHRLQPLDVSFFKPLQTFYGQEQERWLRANPGRQISPFQISSLFNSAYIRAATTATAVNGFAKAAIWPCNRHVFSEADFVASSFLNASSQPTEQLGENTTFSSGAHKTAASTPDPDVSVSAPGPTCSSVAQTAASTPDPDVSVSAPGPDMSGPLPEPDISASTSGHCSSQEQPRNIALALPGKHVICTNPDGRCFFRSVVVSNDCNLQSAERDANGLLVDPALKLQEQFKADMLRAKMAQNMFDNLEKYRQYEPAVNVDMPSSNGPRFHSLEERICHMSSVTAPVGEMEIVATARLLQQPIHVVSSVGGHVLKYCEVDFPAASPVTVLYSSFGDNSGHYDCIISSAASVAMIGIGTGTFLPPLLVSPQVKKRQMRKTEAQVLTSSPYKRKLLASQEKSTNKKKQTKLACPGLIKPRKKIAKKTAKKALATDINAWFCFLCGECSMENMIQCTRCLRWVHDQCAGTLEKQTSYKCDMCQDKHMD